MQVELHCTALHHCVQYLHSTDGKLGVAPYSLASPLPTTLPCRVPNTDTLHALIREYRDARKIPLNVSLAGRSVCGVLPPAAASSSNYLTTRAALPPFSPCTARPPPSFLTRPCPAPQVEHRLMLGMAPDYDHLTVIQKVEVFEHAMDSTSGGWLGAGQLEARVG